MSPICSQDAYQRAFFKKVKLAREGEGWAAEDMAKALGISTDKYYRYESRHMMRHDLIPLFCKLTKIDVDKLMAPPVGRRRNTLESV